MRRLLFVTVLLGLFSCQEPKVEYLNEIKGTGGLFRGFELKDGREAILKNEDSKHLIIDEKVYLRYEYPIDENDTTAGEYNIEYYFDGEDQLHEMIMEIFIVDKAKSAELFQSLSEIFTSKYHEPTKNHEGYSIWKGKTMNTNKLEIAIIDDSKFTENSGYISLQINDFDY